MTPPNISAWQKISLIEAGHFDSNTAYAAVNTLRTDDLRPNIFATHDSGKTWTAIANGIPAGQIINAVREDPEQKGLLFAGGEKGVYVSFDDGANWESLRLNLPASSVRDLSSRMTISSWRRMVAGSGSSTTSRRCDNSTGIKVRICCSNRRLRCVFAKT